MEVYGVIYLLLNKVNGKPYVGQTTQTLKKRLSGHLCGKLCVDRAIRKYKPENFRCDILKVCYSEAELNAWEKFFIAALKTKAPYGYNLTDGGDGVVGWTDEIRAKISAARTGKRHTKESRTKMSVAKMGENNPNYGKPFSDERKAKIGASRRLESPYKNLITELEAHNFSYRRLAELLNSSSPSGISKKIRGIYKFTDEEKAKLVEIFNKPIEYLLQLTEIKNSTSKHDKSPFKNLLIELDAHGLNYTALAKLMGMKLTTLSNKIRGMYKFTDKEKAKLVEIFGKPIEYLLERDDG